MNKDGFQATQTFVNYVNRKFKIYSENDMANAQADRSVNQKKGGYRLLIPQHITELVESMIEKRMSVADILRTLNKNGSIIGETKVRNLIDEYYDKKRY
ncbi:MAG: hypothetical protein ABH986_06650 [archaeon]